MSDDSLNHATVSSLIVPFIVIHAAIVLQLILCVSFLMKITLPLITFLIRRYLLLPHNYWMIMTMVMLNRTAIYIETIGA